MFRCEVNFEKIRPKLNKTRGGGFVLAQMSRPVITSRLEYKQTENTAIKCGYRVTRPVTTSHTTVMDSIY